MAKTKISGLTAIIAQAVVFIVGYPSELHAAWVAPEKVGGPFWTCVLVCHVAWTVHGQTTRNVPVVAMNIVGGSLAAAIISLALR